MTRTVARCGEPLTGETARQWHRALCEAPECRCPGRWFSTATGVLTLEPCRVMTGADRTALCGPHLELLVAARSCPACQHEDESGGDELPDEAHIEDCQAAHACQVHPRVVTAD